ncbi:MAG: HD domain-containing protein [Clostridium sp.]|nr:HD domain-containing protein [Clostridium sp.]
MKDRDIMIAEKIAAAVADAGGRTFYVGGYVRDLLLGRENKDIDIEVHGIPVRTLEDILDRIGHRLMMGASFGIMGLRHYDIDIAMPRSEKAVGRGHRDFEVSVDPFIGYEKAAERRDFTMNALMRDVLTGEILDFFGGTEDLRRGLIRHVSARTFAEDPLRVFRAAQFAARFGFSVAPETTALAASMDCSALSGERIMGELEKALLKAGSPSVFFRELRKMDRLSDWFPEAEALIGVPQDPERHPEGDVWVHTMQVLDQAALLRGEASRPLWFMLAALCHDFGKAVTTTVDGERIHAYGHEKKGLPLAERFLGRITTEVRLREYVLNMTELHMEPNLKAGANARAKSFMKMFDGSVCPEDLLLLAKADALGRQPADPGAGFSAGDYAETEALLRNRLAEYRALMARPFLTGKDLLEAGMEPGPMMGEALAYAHKLRLAGVPKELQLTQTLGYIRAAARDRDKK